MRPKVEWAIYSEAMRARGISVLVKSNLLIIFKSFDVLNVKFGFIPVKTTPDAPIFKL